MFTYRDFPETKNVHSTTCICDEEPIFGVETPSGDVVARHVSLAEAERIINSPNSRRDLILV